MVPVAWLILAATPAGAPAPNLVCAPLAERVVSGAAPLGDLVKRCKNEDVARAALAATVKPDRHGFTTAQRSGGGIAAADLSPWPDFPPARLTWKGRCLARLEETMPPATPVVPLACLDGAILTEQTIEQVEDQRADYLKKTPAILARWNACAARRPAERCLDELLPLSGPVAHLDRDVAAWIASRDAPSDDDPGRQARCALVLADADAGLLAFRCEGSLVDIHCESWANVTFKYADGREQQTTCAGDRKALVVVANVGPAPPPACLATARAALRAARARFPVARVAALRACAPDLDKPHGSDEASSDEEPEEHDHLPPAARLLIHRVLARQQALFGPLRVPPLCEKLGGACTEPEDGGLARPLAEGCGTKVWGVQPDGVGGLSDGSWGGGDDRRLLRLPAASLPRQPAFRETDVTIGRSVRSGNVFANGERYGEPIYNASDVIYDSCVAGKADPDLCRAYSSGGSPDRDVDAEEKGAWRKVAAVVAAAWPRASRRLVRWQRELARGVRLDPTEVELESWDCTPLLLDACTGDLAEVCTGLSRDDASCEDGRLPDGRCRQYRFTRLPLLPAQPAKR